MAGSKKKFLTIKKSQLFGKDEAHLRSHRLAFGMCSFFSSLNASIFEGAAIPHCDFSAFCLRPYSPLAVTGAPNGSLAGIASVSVTAVDSSNATGGDIVVTVHRLTDSSFGKGDFLGVNLQYAQKTERIPNTLTSCRLMVNIFL
jgi:hypothetical protein